MEQRRPPQREQAPAGRCPHLPGAPAVARCCGCGSDLCAACAQRAAARSWCATCRPAAAPRAHAQRRGTAGSVAKLLVLAVGSILGTFALACLLAWQGATRQAEADRESLAHLRFALEDFYLDMSRYPTTQEGFAALVSPDPEMLGRPLDGWRGPYLDLARVRLRWSTQRGGLSDRYGYPVVYYAGPRGAWVYVAAPGPNGQLDSPALGTAAFDGTSQGDDMVVWVEGP